MFSANAELDELHCQDVRRSMLLLLGIGKLVHTIEQLQGEEWYKELFDFLVLRNIEKLCEFKEAELIFFSQGINIAHLIY